MRFATDADMKQAVTSWLERLDTHFFCIVIQGFVVQWNRWLIQQWLSEVWCVPCATRVLCIQQSQSKVLCVIDSWQPGCVTHTMLCAQKDELETAEGYWVALWCVIMCLCVCAQQNTWCVKRMTFSRQCSSCSSVSFWRLRTFCHFSQTLSRLTTSRTPYAPPFR
jgi:hypothetical protein